MLHYSAFIFSELCCVLERKKITTYIVLCQIELLKTRQVANGGWKCPVEHHRRQQQDFRMPIGVSKRPLVIHTDTDTDGHIGKHHVIKQQSL